MKRKLFIKCLSCGATTFTNRLEIIDMVTVDPYLTCDKCGDLLNLVNILVCSRARGGDWCNGCQFRFQCFSSEPVKGA